MNQALNTVVGLFWTIVNILLSAIGGIEQWLRGVLTGLGITGQTQGAILLIAFIVLLIAALQLFGGILRVLIVLFLILLLVSAVMPLVHG